MRHIENNRSEIVDEFNKALLKSIKNSKILMPVQRRKSFQRPLMLENLNNEELTEQLQLAYNV